MEPKRILVVDDDLNVLKFIRRLLEKEGFVVNAAENGAIAWQMLLSDERYDAVVSDIVMPEMNGYQLLENVRGNERLANLPFVLLTFRPPDITREQKGLLGSNDVFLGKPFAPSNLVFSVNQAVGVNAAS